MFPVFADIHLPTRPPVAPGLVLPARRSARFTRGAAATLRGATRSTAADWVSALRAFAASRDAAFSRPPLLAALLLSVGFPPIPVTTIFRGVAMLTSGDAGVRVRASRGVVCVGTGEGVRGPAAR